MRWWCARGGEGEVALAEYSLVVLASEQLTWGESPKAWHEWVQRPSGGYLRTDHGSGRGGRAAEGGCGRSGEMDEEKRHDEGRGSMSERSESWGLSAGCDVVASQCGKVSGHAVLLCTRTSSIVTYIVW